MPSFTTTTLTLSSDNVAAGTVETLTVQVTGHLLFGRSVQVAPGVITFWDGTTSLGTAVLVDKTNSANFGKAILRTRFGIGTHSLSASFAGIRNAFLASSSAAQILTVTGLHPTATTIARSGTQGDYTLKSKVTGTGSPLALTGNVSFLDTSNSNFNLATAALGPSTESLSFFNSANPPSAIPEGVVVADFNGDGIPDIAASNLASKTVTILLGNGDGTFTQTKTSPATSDSGSFAMTGADYNGDGIPDLAVALFDVGTNVNVLLGNGDGTFTNSSNLSTPCCPNRAASGDFNGDGLPDIAMADGDGTIAVFLSNGDGTFTPVTTNPNLSGGFPAGITVADFNGDGVLDMAITNQTSTSLAILLGKGDGTFTLTNIPLTPPDGIPTAVVAGDFNGDGKIDLAVAGANFGTITVLLGNGNGTFTALPETFPSGPTPEGLAAADFNRDGILDLVAANYLAVGQVTVLLGKGDGTFTPIPQTPTTVSEPESPVAVDLNGDGVPDITVGSNNGKSLTVLLTELTQTTTTSVTHIAPAGVGTHNVEASYSGDVNYAPSVSRTTPLIGSRIKTVLVLSSSPTSSTYGKQVLLTAKQNPHSAQNHTTNGESITFSHGATVLGMGTLSSGVATLNFTSLPAGDDNLTAHYPGDAVFAASSASLTVVVNKASQTILWAAIPPQTQGGTVTLSATGGGSGNPVTFSSSTPKVCTVSGHTVSLIAPGTCTLTAKQAGNSNYLPAAPVIHTFSVRPRSS